MKTNKEFVRCGDCYFHYRCISFNRACSSPVYCSDFVHRDSSEAEDYRSSYYHETDRDRDTYSVEVQNGDGYYDDFGDFHRYYDGD